MPKYFLLLLSKKNLETTNLVMYSMCSASDGMALVLELWGSVEYSQVHSDRILKHTTNEWNWSICRLFVLNRNKWNHIKVCKQRILDK